MARDRPGAVDQRRQLRRIEFEHRHLQRGTVVMTTRTDRALDSHVSRAIERSNDDREFVGRDAAELRLALAAFFQDAELQTRVASTGTRPKAPATP